MPKLSIKQLLFNMSQYEASDLHLKVGMPPIFRIDGDLKMLNLPPLTAEDTDRLMSEIIPKGLRERYDKSGDLDFSAFLDTKSFEDEQRGVKAPESDGAGGMQPAVRGEGVDRYRCNIFRAEGGMHGAIRRIKPEIPTFDALNLPPIYAKLAEETHEGLVLVVGVTGCGKSTTLACLLERVNETRACNIVTIEDPVEYHFHPRKSIISQREVGLDVGSYRDALRYIVRQDPDVIFIGELRDHDTVLAAIQAAETGHLVFGSLHTADTMQAFSRIIEFFPQAEHNFVRSALSGSLRAVCAQRLMPANKDATKGVGVVPATEVLLNNAVVREKIRDGEDEDLPAIVQNSREEGMRSFTQSLGELVEKEMITLATAMEFAPNREALQSMLKGVHVRADTGVGRIKG
ncbi:MAG: PilT/PilU family type 4a pilus ATPase [Phycisphaeraceae bacterium]|nr:PilT/PilU family type 4a pilus ATPase [Phycisphaeraceae bacterium]MCB9848346.1 PilT/PilU family type 4a pilus ATPase [Phycisphaeraceae bacterium]